MTHHRNIFDLPTPALLLDWGAASRNIGAASELVAGTGVMLRPHFKSHKCVPLAWAQLAGGNCVGMTVATVDEALALVQAGFEDVLIANQVVGAHKLSGLVRLARCATVLAAVDSLQSAQALELEAQRQGEKVGVLIELNVGHNRWGVVHGEQAAALALEIASMRAVSFRGLQAYHGSGGHILDPVERTSYARNTMEVVRQVSEIITAQGLQCPVVSGAGTGTFLAVLDQGILTELQLGGYLLMDWQFQERMDDLFEVALTVLATVINTSDNCFVIDVGLKGLGNKGGAPRLLGLRHYEVIQWAAEEHTVVKADQHKLCVGDQIRVYPSHAGGTVNLYRNLILHEGELITDVWPISATGYPFVG